MKHIDSGSRGRVRGLVRVGGTIPVGARVSICCEEGAAIPDVNGAYTLEAPAGWHDLWFAAHGAVGESRRVEIVGGEVRVEPEMDLLPWPVVNAACPGGACPRHPASRLRVVAAGTTITLDDLELFARYPFPGDANWGLCLPEFVGYGELLRCETCAQEAGRAMNEAR